MMTAGDQNLAPRLRVRAAAVRESVLFHSHSSCWCVSC